MTPGLEFTPSPVYSVGCSQEGELLDPQASHRELPKAPSGQGRRMCESQGSQEKKQRRVRGWSEESGWGWGGEGAGDGSVS